MKVHTTRFYTVTILSLLVLFMISNVCTAQDWSRKGKPEISFVFQTMGGDDTTADGFPIDIELDDTSVFGFGIGYNFDDHWNLNTEFLFGSMDETWKVGGVTALEVDHNIFLWNVNLDYNIFKDRFTPFVTGGLGIMSFSEWDEDSSDFTYNFGAGVRWDISDQIMLKAMYRATFTEMAETESGMMFDGFTLSVGYMF